MTIEPISSLLVTNSKALTESISKPESNFTQWIGQHVVDTNTQLNAADTALNDLASGRSANLHQTMITMEQAKLSFQYLEQIRNRLMSAYQDLLREQI